jgi:hypothetical protein
LHCGFDGNGPAVDSTQDDFEGFDLFVGISGERFAVWALPHTVELVKAKREQGDMNVSYLLKLSPLLSEPNLFHPDQLA